LLTILASKFLSLSLLPVASTLKHTASVKCFVSLQFLNPETVGRSPWMGDQPFVRPLPIQTHNKHRKIFVTSVGFEPTIAAFERAKSVDVYIELIQQSHVEGRRFVLGPRQ
jgi:hypothetical protein